MNQLSFTDKQLEFLKMLLKLFIENGLYDLLDEHEIPLLEDLFKLLEM